MSGLARRRAVFLDRDGVLVVPQFRDGRSFAPTRLEDFHLYPDARDALDRLKAAGYALVVITNQPDIGKGTTPREVVDEMHRRLLAELPVDMVKTCPHTSADNCSCRKPKPGLIVEAARELGIVVPDSFVVGDRASDVAAGRAAGCRTVFIDLDYVEPKPTDATYVVRSVTEAANVILQSNAEMRVVNAAS